MTSQTAAQLRVHRWGWVVLAILVFGVLVLVSEGIVRFTVSRFQGFSSK